MIVNQYRLRAEILTDVVHFILTAKNVKKDLILNYKISSIHSDVTDVEFEFYSTYDLNVFIEILNNIDDSHTMVRTLEKFDVSKNIYSN